jgi:8-oxo-dGTP pyrophosphatase MutT (NUDIX family)
MASFIRRIPEGDNRERSVCAECGHVAYENPKVVVGSVVAAEGRVLMCRRAIEPRKGFWTLPAGYLELGETLQEGAMREAMEEAEAAIAIDGILQVIFRARFANAGPPVFAPGPESEDVRLFSWDDIPWNDIAFPSVRWALRAWRFAEAEGLRQPVGNPPDDPRGVHRMPPPNADGMEETAL